MTTTTTTNTATAELSDEDMRMLQLEDQWSRTPGAKHQAISEQFGVTPVRYYQRLSRLIDTPAALTTFPLVVNRLRTARAAGRRWLR